jgi:hypothetical protein
LDVAPQRNVTLAAGFCHRQTVSVFVGRLDSTPPMNTLLKIV